jgi:hypothetical protein
MGAQLGRDPDVNDVVKYCTALGAFEAATVRGNKANPQGHGAIKHVGTVHLQRQSGGGVIRDAEPAADHGEHGPGEYCFEPVGTNTSCRLPGT